MPKETGLLTYFDGSGCASHRFLTATSNVFAQDEYCHKITIKIWKSTQTKNHFENNKTVIYCWLLKPTGHFCGFQMTVKHISHFAMFVILPERKNHDTRDFLFRLSCGGKMLCPLYISLRRLQIWVLAREKEKSENDTRDDYGTQQLNGWCWWCRLCCSYCWTLKRMDEQKAVFSGPDFNIIVKVIFELYLIFVEKKNR